MTLSKIKTIEVRRHSLRNSSQRHNRAPSAIVLVLVPGGRAALKWEALDLKRDHVFTIVSRFQRSATEATNCLD